MKTISDELAASHQKAIDDLVREQNLAIENLTKEQVSEVLRQMFACGDIIRHVVCDGPYRQSVIYVPYARAQELESRIKYLEETLRGLGWSEKLLPKDLI